MVKNPPANAEEMGSVPGPGRSHLPGGNWARVPQLQSPRSRAGAWEQERSSQWEARAPQIEKAHTATKT